MKHPIVSRIPSLGLLLVLMSCGESGGRRFGYGKVRYRGLAKNTQRIALLLGFSNLLPRARMPPRLRPPKRRFLRSSLEAWLWSSIPSTRFRLAKRSITTLRVSPTSYVLRSFSRGWIRSTRPQTWVGSRLPSTRDTTSWTRSSTSSDSW